MEVGHEEVNKMQAPLVSFVGHQSDDSDAKCWKRKRPADILHTSLSSTPK